MLNRLTFFTDAAFARALGEVAAPTTALRRDGRVGGRVLGAGIRAAVGGFTAHNAASC